MRTHCTSKRAITQDWHGTDYQSIWVSFPAFGAGQGADSLQAHNLRTEQAYVDWINRFIRHFGRQHPRVKTVTTVWAELRLKLRFREVCHAPIAIALNASVLY